MKTLPLRGVRILSAEQYGAGPFGSMQLADLGAEVIKIENPRDGGDVSRITGPYLLGEGDSQFFQSFNRNKKSLTLDLKSDDGQAVLRRLAASADAVMNNLRGDQPAKLGLTYDALRSVKPSLVCVHLSAYGRDNERANWPGYDYLMQAETGTMHLTGEPDGPPARMGLSIIDYMTGATAAMALLAALLGAQRSGTGGDVDVSLFDVALAQLTYPATWYLNAGHVTRRMPRSAHPSTVPCQLVRTQDGWLFVMCMTAKFWQTLTLEIGRADWPTDPRFDTPEHRREHRQALSDQLDEIFSTRPTASWLEQLTGKLPISPVHNLAQALDSQYVHDLGLIQQVSHPAASSLRLVASPVRLDGERMPARACSALGADTDALLAQAGYDDGDIAALREQGVI